MTKRCLFLLALAACGTTACTPATNLSGREARRAHAEKVPADVGAARRRHADDAKLAAACDWPWETKDVIGAMEKSEWQRSLALAEQRLASCAVDIDARYVAWVSLDKLGREEEAQEQRRWLNGIVEAVLASGTGRSADSPFYVLSIGEEYAVLRVLGFTPQGQALLEGGIDALNVVEGDGTRSTVYFYPEPHWRRLNAMVQAK